MGKKETKFRFKRFSAEHCRSSMKIGVDAVTLGSWADVPESGRILDVGTGCGVIALMCAQRSTDSRILAIDIDLASVEEASGNFAVSEWSERLEARMGDFSEIASLGEERYDLIISNPPYFESGGDPYFSARMGARHKGNLSPEILLEYGSEMLNDGGSLALVVPAEQRARLLGTAREFGLYPQKEMLLRGRPEIEPKRFFVQFGKYILENPKDPEIVDVESEPGRYSERYKELGKDFYLAF